MMNGKKAQMLMENIVFILIVVIFFAMLFAFVTIKGNSVSLIEEASAKRIAMLIDAAAPGTKIIFDAEEIYAKNKINGEAIRVDNLDHVVKVQMDAKTGFIYSYFNDVSIGFEKIEDNGRRYVVLSIT